jgi:hypothetical protein
VPDNPKPIVLPDDFGEQVAAKAQEARKLRAELEQLAVDGALDYGRKDHRDKHQRLDALEAFVYRARRMAP